VTCPGSTHKSEAGGYLSTAHRAHDRQQFVASDVDVDVLQAVLVGLVRPTGPDLAQRDRGLRRGQVLVGLDHVLLHEERLYPPQAHVGSDHELDLLDEEEAERAVELHVEAHGDDDEAGGERAVREVDEEGDGDEEHERGRDDHHDRVEGGDAVEEELVLDFLAERGNC
jgi:hypothetical protein